MDITDKKIVKNVKVPTFELYSSPKIFLADVEDGIRKGNLTNVRIFDGDKVITFGEVLTDLSVLLEKVIRSMKIHDTDQDGVYHFFCPGCECVHWFSTTGNTPHGTMTGPKWTWNGDREKPTVRASILVRHYQYPKTDPDPEKWTFENGKVVGGKDIVCHSFITDGKIQYLNDCTHDLKGQTVDLPDF